MPKALAFPSSWSPCSPPPSTPARARARTIPPWPSPNERRKTRLGEMCVRGRGIAEAEALHDDEARAVHKGIQVVEMLAEKGTGAGHENLIQMHDAQGFGLVGQSRNWRAR